MVLINTCVGFCFCFCQRFSFFFKSLIATSPLFTLSSLRPAQELPSPNRDLSTEKFKIFSMLFYDVPVMKVGQKIFIQFLFVLLPMFTIETGNYQINYKPTISPLNLPLSTVETKTPGWVGEPRHPSPFVSN